jgi:hypothetical protein
MRLIEWLVFRGQKRERERECFSPKGLNGREKAIIQSNIIERQVFLLFSSLLFSYFQRESQEEKSREEKIFLLNPTFL